MISGKKGPDRPKASGQKCGPPTHLHSSSQGSTRAPGRQPRAKPGRGAQPAACQAIWGGRHLAHTAGSLCPSPCQALPELGSPGQGMGELERCRRCRPGTLPAGPRFCLRARAGSGLVVHRIPENWAINQVGKDSGVIESDL